MKSEESGQLDVMGWIKQQFKDKGTGEPIANAKYTIYLTDGTEINGITDDEGYVEQINLKKGKYLIVLGE